MKKYEFINGVQEIGHNLESKRSCSSMESLVSLNLENGISDTGRLALMALPIVEAATDSNAKQISEIDDANHAVSSPKICSTTSKLQQLWPQPQSIVQLEGPGFKLCKQLNIYINENSNSFLELISAWEMHKSMLENLGYEIKILNLSRLSSSDHESFISCVINSNLFQIPESYRLTVGINRLDIVTCDFRGFHNAAATVIQLVRMFNDEKEIPSMHIRDWPKIRYRGILLDFSADARIPTIDMALRTIETLAYLKVNQIYAGVRVSSYSNVNIADIMSDLIQLNHCCWKFGITLIPAIDIDNCTEWSQLIESANSLQDFLTLFPKNDFILIGPKLSSLLVNPTSVIDLRRALSISSQVTLLVCDSEQARAFTADLYFPNDNVIVLNSRSAVSIKNNSSCSSSTRPNIPFGAMIDAIHCNSLGGLPDAILNNMYEVASCIADDGLVLIAADWSKVKFPLTLIYNWPGFVASAGLSWNPSISLKHLQSTIPDALNLYVFKDTAGHLGQVIFELGESESLIQRDLKSTARLNQWDIKDSVLLQLLLEPDNVSFDHLNNEIFIKTIRALKKTQIHLDKMKSQQPDENFWLSEILITVDILQFTCKLGRSLVAIGQNPNSSMGVAVVNLGIANLLPTTRTDLANRLLSLNEHYSKMWLQCYNKNDGLEKAQKCFETLLKQMIPTKPLYNDV